MSLITEEVPPGLLYVPKSPQPLSTSQQGDFDPPETATAGLSPQRQAGGQKASTVTGNVCAVCSEMAPKETVFRKHYGVVCCEACKCFFRRTVQMNRDYKCRYDGRCTIGRFPESMKQVCQACRFSQCIRSGMKMESVKKFPRKAGRDGKTGDHSENGEAKTADQQAKFQKVLKNFSRSKRRARPAGPGGGEEAVGGDGDQVSPPLKQERTESDLDSDPKVSPDMAAVRGMASVGLQEQLRSYSPCSGPVSVGPASAGLTNGESLCHSMASSSCPTSNGGAGPAKRLAPDTQALLSKRLRLDGSLGQFHPVSPTLPAPPAALSVPFSPPPPLPQSAPYTPPSFPQHASSTHYPSHPYSHPGSLVNSPESHPPSVYNSLTNTPYTTPHATPHATPHTTPHGTPVHSPLPSPTAAAPHPPPPHPHPMQPYHPPSSSLLTLPTFTRHSNLLLPQNTSTVFLNSSQQVPFRVLPVAQPILPFMASFSSFQPPLQQTCNGDMASRPSPFSIVPIPSSTSARVSRPQPQPDVELPQPSLPPSETGEVDEPLASAPPSPRASPEPAFKTSSVAGGDTFPEAEVDEVLDSLRQRIRTMFSWAKSDVAGFEDLSPLDQKALLRRTVAELVMLGFARASIAYDGVLLLGKTGKAIRPTNSNSGVSAVASVTLKKLVEPLKVVNMNNKEYSLMKEIVLFNPESSCLRNREVVRAHRRRSHISLKEYTDKHSAGDIGRFGELMCLLTPLFEVSTEVTEQLRLEHFVHEGEARIDALLLMSMINGAEEVGAT